MGVKMRLRVSACVGSPVSDAGVTMSKISAHCKCVNSHTNILTPSETWLTKWVPNRRFCSLIAHSSEVICVLHSEHSGDCICERHGGHSVDCMCEHGYWLDN